MAREARETQADAPIRCRAERWHPAYFDEKALRLLGEMRIAAATGDHQAAISTGEDELERELSAVAATEIRPERLGFSPIDARMRWESVKAGMAALRVARHGDAPVLAGLLFVVAQAAAHFRALVESAQRQGKLEHVLTKPDRVRTRGERSPLARLMIESRRKHFAEQRQ